MKLIENVVQSVDVIHRYMRSVGIAGMTGRGYRNLYRPIVLRTAGGSCV